MLRQGSDRGSVRGSVELPMKSGRRSRGEGKETSDICGTEIKGRRMKSAVGVGSKRGHGWPG